MQPPTPASTTRPRFEPRPCGGALHPAPGPADADADSSPDTSSGKDREWVWTPLIECAAGFPLELFQSAVDQLVQHPEYNSTLILRAEILSDTSSPALEDLPELVPRGSDVRLATDTEAGILNTAAPVPVRCIRRRLLPRRPGRDGALEQFCTMYATDRESPPHTLVLTPIPSEGGELPYYHPKVTHLAFRYVSASGNHAEDGEADATLRVDAIPLPGTDTGLDSRLYRTCLALLDTLHRYGWGAMVNYQKRVQHDCIVPRELYQDVYLLMRERHKHLVGTWQESTDPLKHVFEDIGIATYLMLLWKLTYGPTSARDGKPELEEIISGPPWKTWPRPPGGFVDVGCGNGLLTHILISEGYEGFGFDLRARTSWEAYPESEKACLRVHALDPSSEDRSLFPHGAFLIGNHADELTPWIPVLATLHNASGFLNIPCCAWSFDERFLRAKPPNEFSDMEDVPIEDLRLGAEGSTASSYAVYRIWLAGLSRFCGWDIECDNLRIPSTRNWAIVGRKLLQDTEHGPSNIQAILQHVRDRGVFKTRRPEGKAGDH